MKLSYKQYYDRVLGCWIGKSLGGIVGAPFEGHKIDNNKKPAELWPSIIYPNDDLDIQVVWLELFEERGTMIGRQDLVDYWQDRCWYNFAEYGVYLYNIQRGIQPPLSGRFNNDFFCESMGCPIRAEIWGLVAPGNPALAAEFARMDGEQDHINESVWAEQFWAAATAAAFTAKSLDECLEAGRRAIPPTSQTFQTSLWVPERYHAAGRDWHVTWQDILRRHGSRDGSKGLINFCFTILALHAGDEDFKKTMALTVNMGWDVDCTAATAGALLGTLRGASCMPKDWMKKMGPNLTCDIHVRYKTAPLTEFAAATCKVGLEMALTRNAGVEITGVAPALAGEVKKLLASRKPKAPVEITSTYPGEPVLKAGEPSAITVTLTNNGNKDEAGKLSVKPQKGLIVSPTLASAILPAGGAQTFNLLVRRVPGQDVVWDKNTMDVVWTPAKGKPVTHLTGLAGARQWRVYGPYYDLYDTTRFDECPFRNAKKNCNPCASEGSSSAAHTFVRLEHEYLDEKALLKKDLPAERPFTVECGTTYLDSSLVSGFKGEACWYLVRDVVCSETMDISVKFGTTAPSILWLDGEERIRHTKNGVWSMDEYEMPFSFRKGKSRRVVIKVANSLDEFRVSLCWILKDVPGDKTIGLSYFIDKMGDVIVS